MALPSVPSSVLEVQDFWKKTSYRIGAHVYSLDDIEHGILRGIHRRMSPMAKVHWVFLSVNKVHPASKKSQFAEGDPRIQFCCSRVDPRIHFALVCGAKVGRKSDLIPMKKFWSLVLSSCARLWWSQDRCWALASGKELLQSRNWSQSGWEKGTCSLDSRLIITVFSRWWCQKYLSGMVATLATRPPTF